MSRVVVLEVVWRFSYGAGRMAARLTQDELVEAALAKAGGNKRRLSREAGLDYDYVLRWSSGGTGFKFDTTIALLDYLGWLRVGGEAAPAFGHAGGGSEALATPREGRSSELAAAVRALQDAAGRIVELVEAEEDAPAASARADRRAGSA